LRTLSTTATAIAAGLMTTITRSEPAAAVTLRPGDQAPELMPACSDARTCRLSDRSISLSSVRLGSQGFAASVTDEETNRQSAAYLGSDLPILSDSDKSVARASVMMASGSPARWTFDIGKDGRNLAIDKHVRTATHGADITSTLDSMKDRPGMTNGARTIAAPPDMKGTRNGCATSYVVPFTVCLSQAGGGPPGWSEL
jgi:peroxiredoxin